jgi:hypothetical protein
VSEHPSVTAAQVNAAAEAMKRAATPEELLDRIVEYLTLWRGYHARRFVV